MYSIHIVCHTEDYIERLYSSLEELNQTEFEQHDLRLTVYESIRDLHTNAITENTLIFFEINDDMPEQSLRELQVFKHANRTCVWQMVLLCSSKYNYYEMASRFEIGNLIFEGRFDAGILSVMLKKFFFSNFFGIDSFFKSGYEYDQMFHLSGPTDRSTVFDNYFREFAQQLNEDEAALFELTVQELIFNTLDYGVVGISPSERDENNSRGPKHLDIPMERAPLFRIVQDKEKWAVVATDYSGSLTLQRILSKFQRHIVYSGNPVPKGLEDDSGRGLFLMSRTNRLAINILRKKQTEIVVMHYKKAHLNHYQSLIVNEKAAETPHG